MILTVIQAAMKVNFGCSVTQLTLAKTCEFLANSSALLMTQIQFWWQSLQTYFVQECPSYKQSRLVPDLTHDQGDLCPELCDLLYLKVTALRWSIPRDQLFGNFFVIVVILLRFLVPFEIWAIAVHETRNYQEIARKLPHTLTHFHTHARKATCAHYLTSCPHVHKSHMVNQTCMQAAPVGQHIRARTLRLVCKIQVWSLRSVLPKACMNGLQSLCNLAKNWDFPTDTPSLDK